MHVLNLRKVSVSYDAAEVLADVELDIYDDDFLAVIGPNGGGKTTLVKAILGLIPYNGTIQFLGGLSGPEEIGYLPQINNIDKSFPISVKDTILSGLQNKGQLSGKIFRSLNSHNKAEALMDMVGVYDLKQRHIGTLSGGELQRVLLCRALISAPKLLILDEAAHFVDNALEKEL